MDALASAPTNAGRCKVVTGFLHARLVANRHAACWFTRLADEWLTANPNPQVDLLVARKYRALGAAVRLGMGGAQNWSYAAGDAFYDQAHLIHES